MCRWTRPSRCRPISATSRPPPSCCRGWTAQYLVQDSHTIRPGDKVLIHAAAGGVGQILVQLAKQRGALVTALASTIAKVDFAIAKGACITACARLTTGSEFVRQLSGGGVHVAYDLIGTTLQDSLAATRPRGTVVFYGMAGGNPPLIDPRILMDRSKTLVGGDLWDHLDSRHSRLERAATLFEAFRSGAVAYPEIETFPLSRGADAHRRLESRGVMGKVVLIPDEVA